MIPENIIITKKAEKDLNAINDWYDAQKPGLAEDFMDEFISVLKKIKRTPSAYRFVKKDVRRCRFKRFPYYLYYSPLGKILVLRIRHTKQQPLKRFT